jgi:hypothetical protein
MTNGIRHTNDGGAGKIERGKKARPASQSGKQSKPAKGKKTS